MRAFSVFAISLIALFALPAGAASAQDEPPRADAFEHISNFLACTGNPYALCYYSGPEDPSATVNGQSVPALPCNPNDNQGGATANADCTCYAITSAAAAHERVYNFVEIGSILNPVVRQATIEACGADGSGCLNMRNLGTGQCDADSPVIAEGGECQVAPVCSYLGSIEDGTGQTLYPYLEEAALISTFSLTYSEIYDFGSTPCLEGEPAYAGCMTAPCGEPDENGLTQCTCPMYDGPYQVGQNGAQCDISPNTWSAAYQNISTPHPDGN